MLFRTFSFICLLMSILLLSGCDQEPLSQKGKVVQQHDAIDAPPQTSNNTPQADGNIFQYSTAPSEANQSQNDEVSGEPEKAKKPITTTSEVMEIDWDALIPDSHRPDSDLIEQYNNGEIDEKDPRIIALDKLMQELFDLAPVNSELAGRMVKLPGFVIPIEHDGDKILEFLLVPYHGACIHVPAPPSNQIVYVRVPGGTTAASRVYDTVWVTGRLMIEQIDNDVAESGYVMDAIEVEPFE